MNSEDFDREFDVTNITKKIMVENAELLERLNDYDENGVPYWQKSNEIPEPESLATKIFLNEVCCNGKGCQCGEDNDPR